MKDTTTEVMVKLLNSLYPPTKVLTYNAEHNCMKFLPPFDDINLKKLMTKPVAELTHEEKVVKYILEEYVKLIRG